MKSIIAYDLTGKSPVQKTRIIRTLFGYEDKSNFGKYKYARKGLISKIPNARQIKGAILVEEAYVPKVVRELKKLKVNSSVLDLSESQ
jgi:hypothetical protein